MTTFTPIAPDESYSLAQERQDDFSANYILQWRQKQLLVKRSPQVKESYLRSLQSQQCLVECLKNSPVNLVRIDPTLGDKKLNSWADASKQANKALFLRLPVASELPSKRSPLLWRLKRAMDWIAAAILLLALSPVMLGLVLLMSFSSPGPLFYRQWCVGERGKVFQLLKFRTNAVDTPKLHYEAIANPTNSLNWGDDLCTTPVGRWMRKYSLHQLPQLFNVLRFEMSLVGLRPCTLYDAVQLNPKEQRSLNGLPGITGAWQVKQRSSAISVGEVKHCDMEYLQNWSMWRDLKLLLLTLPKVLSGFATY